VIILTAKGVEPDDEDKKWIDANEYMSKPFSPRRIVDHVKAILSQL
jgi:DNA-binding response OmpR family regulator